MLLHAARSHARAERLALQKMAMGLVTITLVGLVALSAAGTLAAAASSKAPLKDAANSSASALLTSVRGKHPSNGQLELLLCVVDKDTSAGLLRAWLRGAAGANITDHGSSSVVVLALDEQAAGMAAAVTKSTSVHVWRAGGPQAGSSLLRTKYLSIQALLARGAAVLVTDPGSVLLKDPFSHLSRDADLECLTDGAGPHPEGWTDSARGPEGVQDSGTVLRRPSLFHMPLLNPGLFFARPTNRSARFMERMAYLMADPYGHVHGAEQAAFHELAFKPSSSQWAGAHVSVRLLDADHFWSAPRAPLKSTSRLLKHHTQRSAAKEDAVTAAPTSSALGSPAVVYLRAPHPDAGHERAVQAVQRLIASSNSSPSSPGDLRATLDALLLHSPAGAAVGADAGASPAPEQQHDLVPIVQTVRSASLQELRNVTFVRDLILRAGLFPDPRGVYGSDQPHMRSPAQGPGGFWQCPVQLASVLVYLASLAPRSLLEIGTASAWTTTLMTAYLQRFGLQRADTVDVGSAYLDARLPPLWPSAALGLENLRMVRLHLGNGSFDRPLRPEYDLVFIDGDHSYDGVKADFARYGPLARRAVLFHDVHDALTEGVRRFWEELKQRRRAVDSVHEFVMRAAGDAHLPPFMGFGLLELAPGSTIQAAAAPASLP